MNTELENLIKSMLQNAQYAEASDGDAEAPQGYFGIVQIPPFADSLTQQLIEDFDVDAGAWNDSTWPGWYFAWINSDGIVSTEGPYEDRELAQDAFNSELNSYNEWLNRDEEDV